MGEQIGDSSNDLWHSVFNGTAWSANVKIPGQQSKAPPALAFFGGAIHMVHLGNTSNDLWHPVYGTASSGSAHTWSHVLSEGTNCAHIRQARSKVIRRIIH